MSNNREVFSFELNESLYFEEGQEVAEMLGISLDPEISIQPFNDFISIRGVIELQGSYQKELYSSAGDKDTLDFDDYHSRRYVEKVVELDDGKSEFTHRFPVEISVPTYRVADLNDVTVDINSFDYEIPNQSQLKLTSRIEIHGISDQTESSLENESEVANEFLPPREDETFEFDIKTEQETSESEGQFIPENAPTLSTEVDESPSEKERWKNKKSQSLAEFFNKEPVENSPEEESPDESSLNFTDSDYLDESDESRSVDTKDVSYLADMFRSDDDDRYAKMRLCIVQNNDTVETIAKRYEIPALQLVKQNNLSDDSLEEGQLLYIPFKK
ncbi:stage VI sporulation protein D [Virgibacillus sp. JSM 102003]|uniref:stage VI sporulation protein D n=1 Tax=Virgibacillus sp. JSM 102003 TaxID=1562108 RepID=UPI0035BFE931